MKAVPVTDVKNRLSYYLRLVRSGAHITILDRGRPVAVLAPLAEVDDEIGDLVSAGIVSAAEVPMSKSFLSRKLPRARRPVTAALGLDRDDRF